MSRSCIRWLGSAVSVALTGLALPVSSATLRVPADYPTIQAAMDAAAFGDSVLVAPGTYTAFETRTIPWLEGTVTITSLAFLKDGVALIGESGPEGTVLDASGVGTQVTAIVGGGLTSGPVIEGLTLVGRGAAGRSRGIGVNCDTAPLTVRRCIIQDFDMTPFATAAITYGRGPLLLIESCVVRRCKGNTGGALYVTNLDLVIRDSRFEDCAASGGAGAVRVDGLPPGAGHEVVVERTVFMGNSALDAGAFGAGTVTYGGYDSFLFRDCVFEGNESQQGAAAIGVSVPGFTPVRIERCLFRGNRSAVGNPPGSYGGAAYLYGGRAYVIGNTFYDNWAETGGSAVIVQAAVSANFEQNVVASCRDAAALETLSVFQVTSSCNVFWDNTLNTAGFTPSATDRIADPMFCDAAAGSFTVHRTSPCLPENSEGCGLIGAYGEGCGTISIEPTSWGRIKNLFR